MLDRKKIEPLLEDSDYVALSITRPYASLIPLIEEYGQEIWCDLHDYDGVNEYHRAFVEASQYLFLSSDAMADYRGFMERMVEEGKKLVVCTHGRRGSSALTRGGTWIDTPAIEQPQLVDTNGAGDAFFAGFLYGDAQGYSVEVALRYATIAGGLSTRSDELAFRGMSAGLIEGEYRKYYGEGWREE
jgi:sugar/nucleoside kinase (ribokinase family)